MADKVKPAAAPAQVTPNEVATTIAACGSSSDASSQRISAAIVAENYNSGKRGAEAVGTARLSDNVGKCVADAYDDKKPASGGIGGWASRLQESFTNASNSVSAAISDLAIKPGQGPTTVTIHNNTVGRVDPGQKL